MKGISGNHLVLKAGQLEQVVQDCWVSPDLGKPSWVFKNLHEWRFHSLSGNPVPVFDCPQSRKSGGGLCSDRISCVYILMVF